MLVACLDTRWEESRRCFFYSESILQGGLHQLKAGLPWKSGSLLGRFVSFVSTGNATLYLLPLQACGGSIQTSVNALSDDVLGRCELFEEIQIGGDR